MNQTTDFRAGDFGPRERKELLKSLGSKPYDVIVIGAGVTGAGVAVDAATRGLSTLIIDSVDIAAGTSRWSSKLIHGGLRYLARMDLGVAWESAQERDNLIQRIAPHLVFPVRTLIPLDKQTGPVMGVLAGMGVGLGDVLRRVSKTPSALLPGPRKISARRTKHLAPALRSDGLRGGLLYWDGKVIDDARLTTALVRTAAAYGADVLTHAKATNASRHSVTIDLGERQVDVEGMVVSATGVWADDFDDDLQVAPSRGSHLVVPADKVGNPRTIFTVPVPGHFGRFVMVLPIENNLCMVGLTDVSDEGADGHNPKVPLEDEHFLLDTINLVLEQPLAQEDVVGRFAGLRPLVKGGASETADISRKHLLRNIPGKPLTIVGGKLTTYRNMAQETVDMVCAEQGNTRTCHTHIIPLIGAAPRESLLLVKAPPALVRRYGTEAARIMELVRYGDWLADPVVPDMDYLGVELLHAVLHEGAVEVEDMISRRTRITMVDANREAATAVAERVLQLAEQILDAE